MRVAFDGHVLTGKYQGTRTTLLNLLEALAELPHHHHINVYANNPEQVDERLRRFDSQIELKPLDSNSSMKRLIIEFPRIVKADKIDVALFNYIAPLTVPSVLFVHDILPITHPGFFPLPFRWRSRAMFSLSMLFARRIVAVSDYSAAAIKATMPARLSSKVATIRNGPSFPATVYFEEAAAPRARSILYVGRIERRKNFKVLLDAFLKSAPADVQLVVVGSEDLGYRCAIPDDPRIRRLTHLDDAALIREYRRAGLFVYPSAAEGFGLPLLDALLFGIPTLASNRTAMPEVAGDLATYFDPEAPEAVDWLAARIAAHFAGDPVPAPSIEARRRKAEEFSWRRAAAELVALLDTM